MHEELPLQSAKLASPVTRCRQQRYSARAGGSPRRPQLCKLEEQPPSPEQVPAAICVAVEGAHINSTSGGIQGGGTDGAHLHMRTCKSDEQNSAGVATGSNMRSNFRACGIWDGRTQDFRRVDQGQAVQA